MTIQTTTNTMRIYTLLTVLFFEQYTWAQDHSLLYKNLLNPYLANPAQGASQDNAFFILNAKTMVGGIKNTPGNVNFGMNTIMSNGNGIGVKFMHNWSNQFKTVNTELAYNKLKAISSTQEISLGVSVGVTQTSINFESLQNKNNLTDSIIAPNGYDLNKLKLTGGIGFVYRIRNKMEISLSLPIMFTSALPLNGFFIASVSYEYHFNNKHTHILKPIARYYNFSGTPKLADFLLQWQWKKRFMVTSGYRTNGAIITGGTVLYNNFLFSYNYYNYTDTRQPMTPSQNEVAIAMNIIKNIAHKKNRKR